MKASILIGVEKYAEGSQIHDVRYAASDAKAFAAVLRQHDFTKPNQEILVDSQATKTSIESSLRTLAKRLQPGDSLYLYYAGHSFSNAGENYLTCHDTRLSDLENTSVSLRWLFAQLMSTKCDRVVCFLESDSQGLLAEDIVADGYRPFDEEELRAAVDGLANGVGFVACQDGEFAHASSAHKRRIWTHHLIDAFAGEDPGALKGDRLTVASLQAYLTSSVAATLRKVNPQDVQTPWVCGKVASDTTIADFEPIFAKRKHNKIPNYGQVRDSILSARSVMSAKRLSGYAKSKGHSLPDRHDRRSQTFIHTIASPDIKEDIDAVRAALKRAFRLTRTQISATHDEEGAATVTTPFFNYNVNVEQSADDPASVVWKRSIDAISDPDKVLSDSFDSVFEHVFDTVELSLEEKVDLDELIDAIEILGTDDVEVAYTQDENITSCRVSIKGHDVSIEVTPDTFSVIHPKAASPKRLLQSLFEIQVLLKEKHSVTAIPFLNGTQAE